MFVLTESLYFFELTLSLAHTLARVRHLSIMSSAPHRTPVKDQTETKNKIANEKKAQLNTKQEEQRKARTDAQLKRRRSDLFDMLEHRLEEVDQRLKEKTERITEWGDELEYRKWRLRMRIDDAKDRSELAVIEDEVLRFADEVWEEC